MGRQINGFIKPTPAAMMDAYIAYKHNRDAFE